jgi:hypothetical protein
VPLITPKHIEEISDVLLWPVTEDDARTARDMLQSLHFDLSMAEPVGAAPTSHAQVLAEVRDQALEDAALTAEMMQDDYNEHQGHRYPEMRDDAATGAAACASAIRELKTASASNEQGGAQ